MAKITLHFDSKEFAQRAWEKGPGVDYPKDWQPVRLKALCDALEIIRAELGGKAITVLSGYRSEAFNRSIGGAKLSQHVQGRAADIKVAGVPAAKVQEVVLRLCNDGKLPMIKGLGSYPTFTHVDVRISTKLVRWTGSRKNS